jgi:gluconokinase
MIVVVMGVSGCGKSTVARALADARGWRFFDADDYHPAANVEKMSRGIPLDDRDRQPWLEALRDLLAAQDAAGHSAVLACSALKAAYRATLASRVRAIRWVHLAGTYDEVRQLMSRRQGHFMKPGMLQSQFDALEAPADALTLPVLLPVEEQVRRIRAALDPA